MAKKKTLVSDTSVLIDILSADKGILKHAAEFYDIYLPYSILQEIKQLDEKTAMALGLKMYDEDPELIEQAKLQESGLTEADYICMEVSRTEGYICLTNDNGLKNACEKQGITVMRGFRLILNLVEAGLVPKTRAREAGKKIKEENSYIKAETYKRFLDEIEKN